MRPQARRYPREASVLFLCSEVASAFGGYRDLAELATGSTRSRMPPKQTCGLNVSASRSRPPLGGCRLVAHRRR
jgi:hypothetical protein